MPARALLILLLFLLAGCRGQAMATPAPALATRMPTPPPVFPAVGEPGTFQPAACPFALPEDVQQGAGVECGYLAVVEQRGADQAPGGGRIQLAVAIFHPPGGARHPDPVIYLSGGPGGSALEMIRYQFDLLSAPVFAAGRDLVVFDQRGVGLSRPALDCPAFDQETLELLNPEEQGRPPAEADLLQRLLDNLRACREALAQVADLSAYHSAASAGDVYDLVRAFGWQQVNLWGGSYGTRLALEVMRRHPQALRSVVLDAVYPPDVDLYRSAPGNYHRALEKLFAACTENPVCRQAYPDLRQVFFQTVQRLDASPAMSEITDPFSGETSPARMDGKTLLALTFQLLYDSHLRYLLPGQIYAASQGNYTAFEQVRSLLIALQGISSRGMMFSVQCHEEIPFSSPASFQAEMRRYPELGGMYENGLLGGLSYQVCAGWGAGRAEASANQPVVSDVPALLMSGEFDPVTPPEWGRQAAKTLKNGYFFEYPGLGHGASVLGGCPSQMFTAFLEEPTAAPDAACIQEMAR